MSGTTAQGNGRKLTDKEQTFILEYLVDFNVTQAAIRAGYSEGTAYSIGWETLRKPEIRDAIFSEQKDRASRLRIEADWAVLQFVDMYEAARRLNDIKTAIKAMENIGKYLGIYEKDNKQKSGAGNLEALKAKLTARGMKLDREPSAN